MVAHLISPYPLYVSSAVAAGILTVVIGISLIAWLIQSIQQRFNPRRPMVLILVSHLTLFVHLILRAALPTETRNSRAAFTATNFLLAISQRMIILANYDFLTQIYPLRAWISRSIIIGSMITIIGSTILMIPANTLSYDVDKVDLSFKLRQLSAAIVLIATISFYPIWYLIKIIGRMTRQAILVLLISNMMCLFIIIYLVITSVPHYHMATNEQEFWFYVFLFTPHATALITWTILHPKRTLKDNANLSIDSTLRLSEDL